MTPWRYEASARGPRALIGLGLWWGLVGLGLWQVDLNIWIAAVLLVFSLPALWEALRGAKAFLEIGPDEIAWGSGRRAGVVAREEIERLRLDTRLDLSLRVTVILTSGKKVRLPYEAIPRANRLKDVLDQAGMPYTHHHFALLS